MRPSSLGGLALAGATLLGCSDRPDPTGPATPEINLAVTLNERVPFTTLSSNPCNGEAVEFRGFLHNLVHETPDGRGGFHVGLHFNLMLRGAGASGATYIGTEAQTIALSARPPFPATQTLTLHSHVVGGGTAPDFRLHEVLHVTVNAKGGVTTSFDRLRATCRGA
jgi:hypothetical protein